MRSRLPAVLLALCIPMWTTGPPLARAQAQHVAYIKPQFLPPAELARILGVREASGHELMEWRAGSEMHAVEVRRNDAANLVILAGAAEAFARQTNRARSRPRRGARASSPSRPTWWIWRARWTRRPRGSWMAAENRPC